MKKIYFIALIFSILSVSAQQNYLWLKLKKYKVSMLSNDLVETSGLNFSNGKLYTFNDGGNTSELFEINKNTGEIVKKIPTNLENFDWEALTSDDKYFYVGEIGNNWGIRKDLKIYKIQKDNFSNVELIPFYYPEQTDFEKKPQNNDWDAESLEFINSNLHLFTKQWGSKQTVHYKIIPTASMAPQKAEKLETYNLGYLATDASYFDKKLYIIGYTRKMEVFLTIFNEDENGLFFNSIPKKYYLGMSPKLGQIEGIAVNEDGIYISGEEFNFKIFHAPQSYYFIPKDRLK